jgi:SRSO17 transposase
MVDQAKLRWRIERDYLELKQEVGLGHYEGSGWRGFHHHASLCIAGSSMATTRLRDKRRHGQAGRKATTDVAITDVCLSPRRAVTPA